MTVQQRPLEGRRVLVTRAQERSGGLTDRLRDLGADVVLVPLIETEVVAGESAVRASLQRLRAHDGPTFAVFTSATTVRVVDELVPPLADQLAGSTVAAVGPATELALRRRGVRPALVPERFVAEALAGELIDSEVRGARIWLPAAEGARDVLGHMLAAAGAELETLVVYRSVLPTTAALDLRTALEAGVVDAVAFTSGSTVDHFWRALEGRPFPAEAVAACIGPVTAAAAGSAGFPIGVVAARSTTDGLVAALAAHYSGNPMVDG